MGEKQKKSSGKDDNWKWERKEMNFKEENLRRDEEEEEEEKEKKG